MSRNIRNETFVSLVAPSEGIVPFVGLNQKSSEDLPSSAPATPKISVNTNSSTNLLAYNTTISLRNCERSKTRLKRNWFDILVKVTDLVLFTFAIIVGISILITFSTVGLAVYRMCSSDGIAKINMTRVEYSLTSSIENINKKLL